jgi:hypothetical protein
MNSLGAGGQQTPWLVNSANALTFCLMILSATLSSTIANLVGVNWAVFLGGWASCRTLPRCTATMCSARAGSCSSARRRAA